MMRWKRAAVLLLAMCMVFCLCACGGQIGSESQDSQNTQQDMPNSTETPDASDTGTEEPTGTGDSSGTDTPGKEDAPPDAPAASAGVQTLSLQKQRYGLYDWEDDRLLVQSECSHVTMWDEDAAKYPELAEVLEQTANMIKRSTEEEYDNFCVSAREDLPWTREDMFPWVSTLDIQVRRADRVVLSLLSDSYSDYGWIEGFRGMHGTNYDSQTGLELALGDVVNVNNDLANAVANELNSHQWAGDFDYRDSVQVYFANTPYNEFSWTLDYNGVTFYFADGDLTEPGNGRQTATVSFAEYPELFDAKYMAVPEAYMVELPLDSSFFTDLDGNGDLEELNITGFFNTDMGSYSQFGIYADADGSYHYEECFADGFIPYYVKTADGNHYLYLFCEQGEGSGPIPMMLLVVFDVSSGGLTRVGEMNASPGYIPDGIYRIPTDPMEFYLDDFDSMAQDMMIFAVGPTGLPESSGDEGQHESASPEGDTVTVGSIEELLEAIGPHTGILLKPGYYNMSEYIEYVWAKEGESWNERHPYVQLRDCYDGVEVVIRRLDGLSIYGDNENLTEIVVEPRYAQVLNFEECDNITSPA